MYSLFEIAILEHVIDVVPNIFKGDVKIAVGIDHMFNLRPILVAPSALMKAKGAVLLHGRKPDCS